MTKEIVLEGNNVDGKYAGTIDGNRVVKNVEYEVDGGVLHITGIRVFCNGREEKFYVAMTDFDLTVSEWDSKHG